VNGFTLTGRSKCSKGFLTPRLNVQPCQPSPSSLDFLTLLSPSVELLLKTVCRREYDNAPNSKCKTETRQDPTLPTVWPIFAGRRQTASNGGNATADTEHRMSESLTVQQKLSHESKKESK
jgi:hypothetical protein